MTTEIKPLVFEQLSPSLLASLQEKKLYLQWGYDNWLQFMRWNLLNNPFREGQPIGYGLYQNSKLMASIIFTYLPFIFRDKRIIVASGSDFCAFVGCSLKNTLFFSNYCIKNAPTELLITPHASEAVHALWARYGASFMQDSEKTFQKCVSLKNKIFQKIIKPRLNNFTSYQLKRQDFFVKFGKINFLSEISFDDIISIEKIFLSQCKVSFCSIEKKFNYLKWRYLDSPFSSHYFYIEIRQGGKLLGLAIIQKIQSSARICEFIVTPDDILAQKQLLSAAIVLAKKIYCVYLNTKIISSSLESLWSQNKFELTKKTYQQYLIVSSERKIFEEKFPGLFSYGDFKLV